MKEEPSYERLAVDLAARLPARMGVDSRPHHAFGFTHAGMGNPARPAKEMTMATHTPGPYSVDTTNEVRWADSYALMIMAPDGKTPIGTACDFNRTDRDDEKRANARLLSAAPDLLWALESLLEEFGARLSDGKPLGYTVGSMQHALMLVKSASVAIDKARGE